eukprot:243709_1
MINHDLKVFCTDKTIDIMFAEFMKWKCKNEDNIINKSAAEIAYVIYDLPLTKLITHIKNNDINGEKFLEYHRRNEDFIGDTTGWGKNEVYQLQAQFFPKQTLSKQEFIDNMKYIMNKADYLKDCIKKRIAKEILKHDVEQIHF